MAFLKKLRTMFKKKKTKEQIEIVQSCDYSAEPADSNEQGLSHELLKEVDFSYRGDLEAYVRDLTVPRQVIERWVSAGLLFPEEMIMAEKMIKIMRRNEQE